MSVASIWDPSTPNNVADFVAAIFSHSTVYAPGTVGFKLKGEIDITDAPYNCVPDTAVDNSAGIIAALATGKPLFIPKGVFDCASFNPQLGTKVRGGGKLNSRVRCNAVCGTFAEIKNKSWGSISDITIDGNNKANVTFGLCSTSTAAPPPYDGAGNWIFTSVNMCGGKQRNVQLSHPVGNSDVSSVLFISCGAVGGFVDSTVGALAYSGNAPTLDQLYVTGSNTLLIGWINGTIGNAPIDYNIRIDGGAIWLDNTQMFNATLSTILWTDGQFQETHCHSEGIGAHVISSGSTQPIASAISSISHSECVETAINNGRFVIDHGSTRILKLSSIFVNEDIRVNTTNGVIHGDGVIFGTNNLGTRKGKYFVSFGRLVGSDMANTDSICGSVVITLVNGADVQGPRTTKAQLFLVFDQAGGSALIFQNHNTAPVILTTSGVNTFILGAAAPNQIQVKNAGVALGVAFRADASTNGHKLEIQQININ